jgi:aerobic-type carbon monoxide dehydrogenase small subunit (CoxS/CutS family)/carbon monoxide dehydrogenase subunit G
MSVVSMTVNGTPVRLELEPRLTLADALRHRLGLRGTHLGCEHGVCGACTVLVDGRAVRSCLMFAVQAQDAQILTVEGLGREDRLHPLQEAFREHHALQCGFCTAGFLMSAYELLRQGIEPDRRLIAEQLSGVLCRCTGYQGILDAVCELAARGEPLPEPGNLGAPFAAALPPPRAGGANALGRGGEEDGELSAPLRGEAGLGPGRAAQQAGTPQPGFDVTVPQGEPNVVVEVGTEIAQPPQRAWELVSDFPRASRCLPGVRLTAELGEDRYVGEARLAMGPMRFALQGGARVLERDERSQALRAIVVGEDRSGGGVRADLRLRVEPRGGEAALLRVDARVYLSGRAAQFGRSLAGDFSRQLFEQFGACIERTLSGADGGEPQPPPPPGGGALVWRLARARLRQAAGALRKRLERWRSARRA